MGSGGSIVVTSIGGVAIKTETACSFLRFATIQGIESKQDPTGLAPQGCFIAAEAIEREVGQIGETQEASREVSVGSNGRFDSFRPPVGYGFCSSGDVVRCRIETDRVSPPEQRVDNFSRGGINLAGLPEPN